MLILGVLACATSEPAPGPRLPMATVSCGFHTPRVEVAADAQARARGLMFRRDLPEDGGMLFVYDQPTRTAMWMRHTFVPLSVAWLADDGRILGVDDLEPFDETPVPSPAPITLALELPQGWLRGRGLGAGDRCSIELPPELRR